MGNERRKTKVWISIALDTEIQEVSLQPYLHVVGSAFEPTVRRHIYTHNSQHPKSRKHTASRVKLRGHTTPPASQSNLSSAHQYRLRRNHSMEGLCQPNGEWQETKRRTFASKMTGNNVFAQILHTYVVTFQAEVENGNPSFCFDCHALDRRTTFSTN